MGSGRFAKIGLPYPEFLGNFVGGCEIVSGILILFGLATRPAAIITCTIMIVAILTTKTEVLVNKGLWEMLHGIRTDWAMFLGSIFLLVRGRGSYSLDSRLS